MTNQDDSNAPSTNPADEPLPTGNMPPSAIQQQEMGKRPDPGPDSNESKTIKIEEDIRTGERILISITAAGVILNVIIALIYYGQLREMRKATRASEKSADAAAKAADIADKTLKELRAGGTDTHELAVQAGNQAKAAVGQVATLRDLVTANQHTLETIRKNFVADQRPYIWARPREARVEVGKKLKWDVIFENYGRSPAINVRRCAYLDLINIDKSYGGNENAVPPVEIQMQGMPPPARTIEECAQPTEPWRQISSNIMPPQAPDFVTFSNDRELSESDVRVLSKRDGNAFVYGAFFYDDMSGNHYVTIFCSYRLATGAATYCPFWNEMK